MNKLNLAMAISIMTLMFLVRATASAPYDPWYDFDDDGDIDLYDIVDIAGRYGTTGNPTKDVNVTNWPQVQLVNVTSWQHEVPVWWDQYWTGGDWSPEYQSNGFGQLHVLIEVRDLTGGEILVLKVNGKLTRPDGFGFGVVAHTVTLNSVDYFTAFTIPVPAETFMFFASTGGSGDCNIYLSFYLT